MADFYMALYEQEYSARQVWQSQHQMMTWTYGTKNPFSSTSPTASFASTEVTQAVTAADDLYRKGLNKFNCIKHDLYSIGLKQK